jgi:hypothetical protein
MVLAMTEVVATVEQAALQLGVSTAYVKKLIKVGKLDARQVPRDVKRMRWEIAQTSIDAFAQNRESTDNQSGVTLDRAIGISSLALQRASSMDAEIVQLRRSLAIALAERDGALKQRDDQLTMAMTLANDLDTARAELARVRRAQAALLTAHSALLGTDADLPVR